MMFDAPLPLIEAAWARFVAQLPPDLRAAAARLPAQLGRPEHHDWSALASSPVGALPWFLVGRGVDDTPRVLRDRAVEAHAFAVLSAALECRLRDGRLAPDESTSALLTYMRVERDRLLASLLRSSEGDFRQAERDTAEAVAESQSVLAGGAPITWPVYRALARAAQALAFPASTAMAVAAGWPRGPRRRLDAIVEGIALGLRYRDDAVDWLDDHRRHASWAVALADLPPGLTYDPDAIAEVLHQQGILTRMLQLSVVAFEQAARSAAALGADAIARWALIEARRSRRLALKPTPASRGARRHPSASPAPMLSALVSDDDEARVPRRVSLLGARRSA